MEVEHSFGMYKFYERNAIIELCMRVGRRRKNNNIKIFKFVFAAFVLASKILKEWLTENTKGFL